MPPIRQQPSNVDMRFQDQESAGKSPVDSFSEILNRIMKLRDLSYAMHDVCNTLSIVGVCKASIESSTYVTVEHCVQNCTNTLLYRTHSQCPAQPNVRLRGSATRHRTSWIVIPAVFDASSTQGS